MPEPGSDTRREFGFTPDWRAQIPFLLMPLRVCLLVGLPLWLAWLVWQEMGLDGLRGIMFLGALALAGAGHVAQSGNRLVRYRARLREGEIEVDAGGIRLLPPFGKWRTFPWSEVTELRVVTAGGLLGDGLIGVDAGGVPMSIPPYVDDREELLALIRERAGLTDVRRGWWATTWRRA